MNCGQSKKCKTVFLTRFQTILRGSRSFCPSPCVHNHFMPQPPVTPTPSKALSAPQKALRKLGLDRDIDLALHLPLRYEDETRIVKLRDAREGDTVQIEATVTSCDISFKPRRQLLVTVNDASDTCVLRFFSFYPSHQKALAVGNRLRLRGEVRGGFGGFDHDAPHVQSGGWRVARRTDTCLPDGGWLAPNLFAPRGDHGLNACRFD